MVSPRARLRGSLLSTVCLAAAVAMAAPTDARADAAERQASASDPAPAQSVQTSNRSAKGSKRQDTVTLTPQDVVITPAAAEGGDPVKWHPRAEVGGYVGTQDLSRGEVGLFFPLYQDLDSLLFADLRGRFFDGDNQEGNFALGFRQMLDQGWNLGVWAGIDVRRSSFNNTFPQVAGGLEVLHPDLGFRFNGYVPLDSSDLVGTSTATTGAGGTGMTMLQLLGNQLFLVTPGGTTTTTTTRELALYGLDGEFEFRVPFEMLGQGDGTAGFSSQDNLGATLDHELRIAAGGYYFDHKDLPGEVAGPRARAEWRFNNVLAAFPGSRLTLEAQYQYDDIRKDQFESTLR